jgi:hypothetical protein
MHFAGALARAGWIASSLRNDDQALLSVIAE